MTPFELSLENDLHIEWQRFVNEWLFRWHGMRAARGRRRGFADAMAEEPSRLVGHAEHALELERAHALLARAHQVHREQPLGQRNLAALHDRADRDGKLAVA